MIELFTQFDLHELLLARGLLGGNRAVASLLGFGALAMGVFTVYSALNVWPKAEAWVVRAMVFFTCWIRKPIYIELYFHDYQGYDRGFGVTIPDILLLGLFFKILTERQDRQLTLWPYNVGPWLVFVALAAISMFGAGEPLYSVFSLYRFARGLILYWVVVNVIRTPKDIMPFIDGIIAALLFQWYIVFRDKYITRSVVVRVHGTFPHPNSLAMYCNLATPLLLSLYLSGHINGKRGFLACVAIFAAMLMVVFTRSRAALVLMGAALPGVVVVTTLRRPTLRKAALLAAGTVAVVVMGILAAPRIIERFQTAPEASGEAREVFNDAARAMAKDHFFGVGINNYSWTTSHTEYYWYVHPHRALLDVTEEEYRESREGRNRMGNAHHIYWITAAETGWIGLGAFMFWAFRFLWLNAILFLRTRNIFYWSICLGLISGFCTFWLQGLLEWVFHQTAVYFFFWILTGILGAIWKFDKAEREEKARRRALAARRRRTMRATMREPALV